MFFEHADTRFRELAQEWKDRQALEHKAEMEAERAAGMQSFRHVQGRGAAKVGRNDPCPCGSGKKYKRCCGLTT
jgi:uncharacterized protein YecA (UPF0149 family)